MEERTARKKAQVLYLVTYKMNEVKALTIAHIYEPNYLDFTKLTLSSDEVLSFNVVCRLSIH